MEDLSEQRRVGEGDALMCVLEDLKRSAISIRGNAPALVRWAGSAADLLACVPDMGQRMGWSIALAQAVALPIGTMVEALAGELLRRAEEVRRCRVS